MAFNLKKVLKALLLSSNQPLSIKDIQAAFTRFHDRAMEFESEELDAGEAPPGTEASPPQPATPAPATETPPASDKSAAATESGLGAGETPISEAPGAAAASETTPVTAAASDTTPTAAAPEPASAGDGATPSVPALTPAPADSVALPATTTPPTSAGASAADLAEEVIESGSNDPELYADVPSLITATQIREAMDQIAAELRAADEGLLLIEGNAGYRLVTHPRFARWVRILRQEPPPMKLSQSSIETLAVIAYRQPVTRGEIETIRGVSAEAGINKLLERELVYIVGRADAPGRPIQYGTTDQFLEFVGIKSLDELPASDVLSSRQIDEWLKTNASGHKPNDSDMGLPDEQLPLEAGATRAADEGEPQAAAEKTAVAGDAPAAPATEPHQS
jgi:segregation and condensation protein B